MRKRKNFFPTINYLYLTLLLCLFTKISRAQDNAFSQVDIQAALALPFNQNISIDTTSNNDLIAYGIGGGFMVPLSKKLPLYLGANFKYMWTGGKTRNFDKTDSNGNNYNLESKISGSMSPLHAVIRIDPMHYTNFPVMPYISGFAGVRFFGAKQKITINYQNGNQPIEDKSNKINVASSYGFEVGLHIRTSEDVFIDLQYEHAYGGSAEYIDLSSIEIDEFGNASYDQIETRTNVSIYTLGVAFKI